ncbi:hypothetical protein SAMN05421769_2969 [Chryseobacterium scophthalmum]|uniref:Uncharacterized protein n=1 Tax=Chryseobacterium scophthalmum TaxID=59733 RepID=A0A1N6HXC7_9FLAO|nr:hypothetical protein SAMN05421769_2969 [Chryseobacterium scophthalmum]
MFSIQKIINKKSRARALDFNLFVRASKLSQAPF